MSEHKGNFAGTLLAIGAGVFIGYACGNKEFRKSVADKTTKAFHTVKSKFEDLKNGNDSQDDSDK